LRGGRVALAARSLCDDDRMSAARSGEGWAATTLDDLGDGPGFRKIRPAIGVTAFGINAIVLPAGIETGRHYHDRQEEVYFVHRGRLEMEFGDGERVELGPGGVARVDAATVRRLRNVGDEDAVYVVVGGADGYIGRDGRVPEDETEPVRQTAPPAGA
jgi:mannose-6-phosphate isomerase-like protein (cupin superfamily)